MFNKMKLSWQRKQVLSFLEKRTSSDKVKKFCQKQLPVEILELFFNHPGTNVARFLHIVVKTQILPENLQLKIIEEDSYPFLLVDGKNLTPKVQLELVKALVDLEYFGLEYEKLLQHDNLTDATLKELLICAPYSFLKYYGTDKARLGKIYHLLLEIYGSDNREIKWSPWDTDALRSFFVDNNYPAHSFPYPFFAPLMVTATSGQENNLNELNSFGRRHFKICLQYCNGVNSNFDDFEDSFFALAETWFGSFHDLVEAAVILGPDVSVFKKKKAVI